MAQQTYPGVVDGNSAVVTNFELAGWHGTDVSRVGEPAELYKTKWTNGRVGVRQTLLSFIVQVFVLFTDNGCEH